MASVSSSPEESGHVAGEVGFALSESGAGRPALVLHGGGGPLTVAAIARHLSASMRAITPTHPGWEGTERPATLTKVDDLAALYLDYLERTDLRDVLLVGSSLGGWIATAMALHDRADRVSGLILIDAVGVEIAGEPIRDFFALDPRGIAEYSYHDAARFSVDPSTVAPERAALQRSNIAALKVFAGDPYMHDPQLLGRLGEIGIPTLVIWGESDRIVTPAYGEAYAAAFGNARFEVVERAGHLPHIEQPAATFALIDEFLRRA